MSYESVVQELIYIRETLVEQTKLTREILTYWKQQDARATRGEERAIEAHELASKLFQAILDRENRATEAEKENKERFEKYVNPFLKGTPK